MQDINTLTERLSELRTRLNNFKFVLQSPDYSRRDKSAARTLAQSLGFAIEQLEWVLCLRKRTAIDYWKAIENEW